MLQISKARMERTENGANYHTTDLFSAILFALENMNSTL